MKRKKEKKQKQKEWKREAASDDRAADPEL